MNSLPMRFRDFPLQTKFFLSFSLLGIVPLLILALVLAQFSTNALEGQTFLLMEKLVKQINRTIDYNINDLERLTLTPIANQDVQAVLRKSSAGEARERLMDRRIVETMMFTMDFMRSDIVGIYVFGQNGANFSRLSIIDSDPPEMLRDLPWHRKTLQMNGQKFISTGIRHGTRSAKSFQVLSVARVIKDSETPGDLGVILVDADMSLIARLCQESRFGEQGSIVLLDKDGAVLYRTSGETGNSREILPMIEGEAQLFAHFKGSTDVTKFRIERNDLVVASSFSETTGLTTLSLVPLKALDQGGLQLRWVTGLLLVLCLSASLLAAYFIARTITGPVRMLRGRMLQAESGDFGEELTPQTRDEIGQLTKSFNTMSRKITDLIQTVYVAELHQKDAELQALQSQINPHFLYNTLELIRALALDSGALAVVDITRSMGDLMRYNLGKSADRVTLAQEITYIRNYLAIQQSRFGERFQSEIKIDESHLAVSLLRLTLQPLVENALRHGIETKSGIGHLSIESERRGDNLVITIVDDGSGVSPERLQTIREALDTGQGEIEGSIGLVNVHQRLKLNFGPGAGLWFESQVDQGSRVTVTVPFKEAF